MYVNVYYIHVCNMSDDNHININTHTATHLNCNAYAL